MAPRAKEVLSDARVRAAKAKDKAYKLRDGGGLHLLVTPSGSRLWRLRYGHGKTESMVSLGSYPEVSLSRAREKAVGYRGGIIDGITPAAAKRDDRKAQANTFEAVAREWFGKQRYAPATRDKIEWLMGLLFPHIGNRPVGSLEPPDILDVLQRIEARGKHETAHRARALVGKVMRYAIATSRAQRDPAADLRDALAPVEVTNHASIKDPVGVGRLLRAIDGYRGRGHPVVEAALRLAPLVFVRPGELRGAEWSEFNLDGDAPEWRIPAERMKMRREHIVPLSKQAVAILREIQQHTGRGRYVFPSIRTHERPMSENTLNAGLRGLGYTGDVMTAHGFRSLASTRLNEATTKNGSKRWHVDWIERQLAHVDGSVRGDYNAAEYIGDRRRMMQAWADYLDGLKASDKVPVGTSA